MTGPLALVLDVIRRGVIDPDGRTALYLGPDVRGADPLPADVEAAALSCWIEVCRHRGAVWAVLTDEGHREAAGVPEAVFGAAWGRA